MMGNPLNTDRRGLLGAAPLIAAAAAIPAVAIASAPTNAGWEQAKAIYRSATAAASTSYERYERADMAARAALPAEPAPRTIRYAEPGFDNGRVLLRPYEATRTLKARDALDAPPAGLDEHPVFLAYQAEAAAWDRACKECSDRFMVDALEDEWARIEHQRFEAWQALISYPVATFAELTDKMQVASQYAGETNDGAASLLEAVTSDVLRLAGEARHG
jgi:hypothetical protein